MITSEDQHGLPLFSTGHHGALKRCLLVFCRDRVAMDNEKTWFFRSRQQRNHQPRDRFPCRTVNTNGSKSSSSCTWSRLAINRHSSASSCSAPMPNNPIDDSSMSKTTLILAGEQDDDYEPLIPSK